MFEEYYFGKEEIMEANIDTLISMGDYMTKEFYMESSSEEFNPPDPTGKFTRFQNYVKRAITTILARIQSNKYKKIIKKCKDFDYNRTDFQIDSRDKYILHRLSHNPIKEEYQNQGLSYNRNEIDTYRKNQKKYQKIINDLNNYRNYQEKEVSLSGAELKKYIDWIDSEGKLMTEELPKINGYLKEISDKLSDDDRKDDTFQHYTQMITYMMQMDLMIVKHIVGFMEYICRYNDLRKSSSDPVTSGKYKMPETQKSNTEDSTESTDTSTKSEPKTKKKEKDEHGCILLDERPDYTNNATQLEKTTLPKLVVAAINAVSNLIARKKYPKVNEVYAYRDKSKHEIRLVMNTKIKSNEDWRMLLFNENNLDKVPGITKKMKKEILDAFEIYPCAYSVK